MSLTLMITALAIAPADTVPADNLRLSTALAKLDPSHFARHVSIKGDGLDDTIVISTEDGTRKPGPAKGANVKDGHVQVRIDVQTGQARWEAWHDLTYSGAKREISEVRYRVADSLVKISPTFVTHWVDHCPEAPGDCTQSTRVVFEIPEAHVQRIAEAYRPQSRTPWLIRLKESTGEDVTVGIAPAEVAGAWQAYLARKSR